MNSCTFQGNLTRDPELRYLDNGTAVTTLYMAINSRKTPLYIDVEVWGKHAETICQYCKKGKPLFVVTEAVVDEWVDKSTGNKRSKIKFKLDRFNFVPGSDFKKKDDEEQEETTPQPKKVSRAKPKNEAPVTEADDSDDNGIPF